MFAALEKLRRKPGAHIERLSEFKPSRMRAAIIEA